MLTSMESYLRRGQLFLRRWLLTPWVRALAMAMGCGGGGFFLSAGSLLRYAQPLAMGFVAALTGWQAVAAGVGAMAGYWAFWQRAGNQGMVWGASGTLLALMLGKAVNIRDQPLVIPAIAAFLTAITGLAFQIFGLGSVPVGIYLLRLGVAFFSCVIFTQGFERRSNLTDWLMGGLAVLALAQVSLGPYLGFGYLAAGALTVTGSLPGAVLAGLGLDLAQVAPVSMTGAMGLAWMLRMVPFERQWLRYTLPGAAYLVVAVFSGCWDMTPLPALVLGGALGYLVPPRPEALPRRGQTGFAQVRLELGAQVLATTRQLLQERKSAPIDQETILRRAQDRACGSCSYRKSCPEMGKLTPFHLQNPLEVDCRKQGRLIPELRRGQEQLRLLKADHHRQAEYRWALEQQYRFLEAYLHSLADSLPRREKVARPCFRVEIGARTAGKERANGDRCLAFPGQACRYYVLLCDGMGTGLGAAQAGQTAGNLLKQMLTAGFPARHALRSVNSLLVLGENAGAVTLDLAEVCLDTGYVLLYKWGAAPSLLLSRKGAEKIGTASPPPGLSLEEARETVERLSLRRGEALVMLSDGVDGEEISRQTGPYTQGPPGELAADLLRLGCEKHTDDATVAVIRLRPVSLAPS